MSGFPFESRLAKYRNSSEQCFRLCPRSYQSYDVQLDVISSFPSKIFYVHLCLFWMQKCGINKRHTSNKCLTHRPVSKGNISREMLYYGSERKTEKESCSYYDLLKNMNFFNVPEFRRYWFDWNGSECVLFFIAINPVCI